MMESFVRCIARVSVTACALALAGCGAVANDAPTYGADAASYEAAVEAGTAEARDEEGDPMFACGPDSGPYSIGAFLVPWTPTGNVSSPSAATLRWTGCDSPPIWMGAEDRVVTSFADPRAHAPVMEGPGYLPTVGPLLPDEKADPFLYGPGMTMGPPLLDAASFSSTVHLRDDTAAIVVFVVDRTPSDPTCGDVAGVQTWLPAHPEIVAQVHDVAAPAAGAWFSRYDVFEGVPAGETEPVSVAFSRCAIYANPTWQLPPLLAGHVHVLIANVGAVKGP